MESYCSVMVVFVLVVVVVVVVVRNAFVCNWEWIYVHFTGRSACGKLFYVDLGCSLRFGGSLCLSLLHLFFESIVGDTLLVTWQKWQSHGPGHKSTVVNRESIHVVTKNSNFSLKWGACMTSTVSNSGSGALACGGAQETSHVLLHVGANRDSPVSGRWHTCGGKAAKEGTRARTSHKVRSLCISGFRK